MPLFPLAAVVMGILNIAGYASISWGLIALVFFGPFLALLAIALACGGVAAVASAIRPPRYLRRR